MHQRLIIELNRSDALYWRDLWRYRELFLVLAWRDLSVRYKETVFGVLWALVRPFVTMVVFTVIFGRLAKFPSDGDVPYPLMVLVGMIVWTLFSTSWMEAGSSLVRDASLITKVYFPRLIIPAATIVVNLVDFFISFALLVVLMGWYRFVPGWQIAFLPFFLVLVFLATLGPTVWIAALNIRYRDVRYMVPFLLQLALYVSPVGFSSNIVSANWRWLYSLNPVVGIIDGFRWCLLGGQGGFYIPGFCWSLAVTVLFLWLGLRQFRSIEKRFADLL
jgi:lipopolysaccharide transport system permease protein